MATSEFLKVLNTPPLALEARGIESVDLPKSGHLLLEVTPRIGQAAENITLLRQALRQQGYNPDFIEEKATSAAYHEEMHDQTYVKKLLEGIGTTFAVLPLLDSGDGMLKDQGQGIGVLTPAGSVRWLETHTVGVNLLLLIREFQTLSEIPPYKIQRLCYDDNPMKPFVEKVMNNDKFYQLFNQFLKLKENFDIQKPRLQLSSAIQQEKSHIYTAVNSVAKLRKNTLFVFTRDSQLPKPSGEAKRLFAELYKSAAIALGQPNQEKMPILETPYICLADLATGSIPTGPDAQRDIYVNILPYPHYNQNAKVTFLPIPLGDNAVVGSEVQTGDKTYTTINDIMSLPITFRQ